MFTGRIVMILQLRPASCVGFLQHTMNNNDQSHGDCWGGSDKKRKAVQFLQNQSDESIFSAKKLRTKSAVVDRLIALLGTQKISCTQKISFAVSGHKDVGSDAVFRKLEGLYIGNFNAGWMKRNTDWRSFIVRILQAIDLRVPKNSLWKASTISGNYKEIPQLLVSGPPQSGKTSWIAMLCIAAKQKKICTVVLTMTTDLCCKMSENLNQIYFDTLPEVDRPTCIYIGCREVQDSRSNHAVKRCLLDHGVIVVNFHAMSIKHLLCAVCELRGYGNACKFILVKDESDVLHHEKGTDRHHQLARLEGRELLEYGCYFGCPLLILNVTSRPLTVLSRLHMEQDRVLGLDDWYHNAPGVGYVGLDRMRRFLGRFLRDGELTRRNGFWSDSVEALYSDAHPDRPCEQRPGVLVIDGASRLVRTRDSIKRRADFVQARCPRFAAVLLWGAGGCAVRYPDGGGWIEGECLARLVDRCLARREEASDSDRDCSLLDLLRQEPAEPQALADYGPRQDRGDSDAGPARVTAARLLACVDPPPHANTLAQALRRPLVVMGSSRFLGESLASAVRTPTHLVCPARPAGAKGSPLGWGMSHGGALLRRDGRQSVLVLATRADWAAAADPARHVEALRLAFCAAPAAGSTGDTGRGQPRGTAGLGGESLPQQPDRDCKDQQFVDLTLPEEAGLPFEPAKVPSDSGCSVIVEPAKPAAKVPSDSGCSVIVDLSHDEGGAAHHCHQPAYRRPIVDLTHDDSQQLQPLVVDLSGSPD